jgi:hypothetical protein
MVRGGEHRKPGTLQRAPSGEEGRVLFQYANGDRPASGRKSKLAEVQRNEIGREFCRELDAKRPARTEAVKAPLPTVCVPVGQKVGADTTGNGQVDTFGMDTTGDGKLNAIALDTTGDGRIDKVYQKSRHRAQRGASTSGNATILHEGLLLRRSFLLHRKKYALLLSDRRLLLFKSKADAEAAKSSRNLADGEVKMTLLSFGGVQIATHYEVETIELGGGSGKIVKTMAGFAVHCNDAQSGEAFHIYSGSKADDEELRAWHCTISNLMR